jgi:hypothetical protein
MIERLAILIHHHDCIDSKIYFHAFFNVLPKTPSIEGRSRRDHKELYTHPVYDKNRHRVFCNFPPQEIKKEFYTTLPSTLDDEITAHMAMFDGQTLGNEHYFWVVDLVSDHIIKGLEHVKWGMN